MHNVTGSVKNIEDEAEKILESARAKANEILAKARQQTEQILSAELSLDEVKAQCREIIEQADREAAGQVEASREKAKQIKAGAAEKVDELSKRMVNIVSGAQKR